MKSQILRASPLLGLALLWSPSAHALSCDEIMSMVNVNVPTNIIVQTIEDSGQEFTSDEIRCLTNEGAPGEIVSAAKNAAADNAPKPDDEPVRGETTKAKPSSKSDEEFDNTEAIGSSKKSNLKDLPEEDDEEAEGRDPAALEDAIKAYNAKKPLTSSYALSEMLRENQFPDKESKILYYLARSLYDLQMYHSSQYYFIEVLKKGPQNPYFKYALPKLVSIAKATGDESDLARIVSKIPPEEFPKSARNQLYYLLGVRMYEQDKLSEARKYFDQVSEKSDLYTRAKYFTGVIYNKQGKLKSAVKAFTEVVKTEASAATQQELEELDRLRDLSLLNIARIYYGIEQFEQADTYYDNVPRTSRYWPESLFERAWSNFMQSDLNLTLGLLLTLESPFYKKDEFIPEATILRALTFFNLCEFDDVDRLLLDFDERYRPMYTELKDFLKQYSTEEGRKLADQAYDRYFGDRPADTVLPKSLFARALRDQELSGIVTHLELMEREEALIDSQKSQWKDGVGEQLHKIISEDRERLKRRAGLALLSEMATATNNLGDLLTQAEIIRFEVVDARRGIINQMMAGDRMKESSKDDIDFAVSTNKIYWPFNGEFWQDELGYYRYTEQGSCK
jgi:TolA-binding protein